MKNANSSSDETPLETKSRFDTSLDLLDRLLQVPTAENDEDPDGLTEAEIRGAQIGLLLGSLDTSFGTLQLALLELSSMPDLQAGLASEIVDINALSFDDIPSVRLHHAVIKETMHLHTVYPLHPTYRNPRYPSPRNDGSQKTRRVCHFLGLEMGQLNALGRSRL